MSAVLNEEMRALEDAAGTIWRAFAEGFRPAQRINVSEWADQHRRLPSKGSAEPGRWRTSRVPYLREIMDVLSESHPAREIVFQKSVQSGGTEAGNNWVGWFMDMRKAPMMVVEPTLDLAERWSKQRLAAMIEDTPRLREKINPARSRDSGNTTLLKEWPGGVLAIAGANSAAGLCSMPACYLMLDETDRYPFEIENEGDPVELAEGRTTTFVRYKIFRVSTPTTKALSRINKAFVASDQRRYYVPCPHCDHYQVLHWDNLGWPEGRPGEARYACAECGALIEEHHKADMLARGEWRATYPERAVVGFHINALYTPIGLGKSWADLAEQFEKIGTDAAKKKAFTNLRLGEVTDDPNEKLDAEELMNRAEARAVRTIPPGCLLLTAGIDVQKDRWAVTILGWGRGAVTWIIDWFERPGDPTSPSSWAELEAQVMTPIINAYGVPMRPERMAVDSGYLQDDVMNFTRTRRERGWFAIKGAKDAGRPIIARPTRVDFTWRGRVIKNGAEQWQVGGHAAKQWLFTRLVTDRERLPEDRLVRFPAALGDIFYEQLTAEVFDEARNRFVKIRERNEALDTCCYGIAAACHPLLRANTWDDARWAKREAMLQPERDLFGTVPVASVSPVAAVEPEKPAAAKAANEFNLAAERRRQLQQRYEETLDAE